MLALDSPLGVIRPYRQYLDLAVNIMFISIASYYVLISEKASSYYLTLLKNILSFT